MRHNPDNMSNGHTNIYLRDNAGNQIETAQAKTETPEITRM